MTRFVLLLPAATHKMLEAGARRRKCSKAFYARIVIDAGAKSEADDIGVAHDPSTPSTI